MTEHQQKCEKVMELLEASRNFKADLENDTDADDVLKESMEIEVDSLKRDLRSRRSMTKDIVVTPAKDHLRRFLIDTADIERLAKDLEEALEALDGKLGEES
jgi:hypothetical protein